MGTIDTHGFIDSLVMSGLVSRAQAQRAVGALQKTEASIETVLLELGILQEQQIYRELSIFSGAALVSPSDCDPSFIEGVGLPFDYMNQNLIVPIRERDGVLVIAGTRIDSASDTDGVSFFVGMPVEFALMCPSDFSLVIKELNPSNTPATKRGAEDDINRLNTLAQDGPIIKKVNNIIAQSVELGASDIHIESAEDGLHVRCRVDGLLRKQENLPSSIQAAIISRLKVMADLNIAERRIPQDGRIHLTVRGRGIDIRMSTLPTQYGESVVLRILDRHRLRLDLKDLGYHAEKKRKIETILDQPNGLFLVAGPTGSGKTTSLYAALKYLNQPFRKLVTVEDPIEYAFEGLNQVQVDLSVDMGFGRALRSILRQDPDVVMIGEIRDHDTAEIAARAALVGRLVLSTIHSNDAISAVPRMIDLGVPPLLLSTTLRGVLAQRLVPRCCTDCGGSGCEKCDHSGSRGRTVVAELLEITPEIASAISDEQPPDVIRAIAQEHGFTSMGEDASAKVREGDIARSLAVQVLGAGAL